MTKRKQKNKKLSKSETVNELKDIIEIQKDAMKKGFEELLFSNPQEPELHLNTLRLLYNTIKGW